MPIRRPLGLAAVLAPLALLTMAAAPRTPPAPALRGPESPAPITPPPSRSGPLYSQAPDSTQRFTFDIAPRLGGLVSGDGDGRCRQSCARDYYQCSATEGAQECSPAWTQCLATCSKDPAGGV